MRPPLWRIQSACRAGSVDGRKAGTPASDRVLPQFGNPSMNRVGGAAITGATVAVK